MKKTLVITLLILCAGCKSTKRISFQTDTFISKGQKEKFEIILPRNYVKSTSDLQNYLFRKWSYADDSFVYVFLDISFANSPNVENWIKCSDLNKKLKCTEGTDEKGRLWKELLVNGVVIGYKNVPATEKAAFDEALQSFKKL